MGIGAAAAIEWTGLKKAGRFGKRNLVRWSLVIAAASVLVVQGLSGYRQIQALRSPFLRDWSASFLQVIEPGAWVLMPPAGSPVFLRAWALRYRAWAVPDGSSVTMVAPPGFSPPGPPPGYLTWEAAAPELPHHPVYALTLEDTRLTGKRVAAVKGPGGDTLGYKVLWPPARKTMPSLWRLHGREQVEKTPAERVIRDAPPRTPPTVLRGSPGSRVLRISPKMRTATGVGCVIVMASETVVTTHLPRTRVPGSVVLTNARWIRLV